MSQGELARPVGLVARRIEHARELDVREWDALCDECPWCTTFQRPAWVRASLRHLEGEDSARVVEVRRGARLVGVLPLAVLRGEPSTWVIAGTGPSDRLDVIARESEALEVARLSLRTVAAWTGWRALELHELDERSPLLRAAREGVAGRVAVDDALSVAPVWIRGAPERELGDASWARRVRTDRRRAARDGLTIEVAGAETLEPALAAWVRNHQARWNARGEAGALEGRTELLVHAVRALAPEGRAELVSLVRGDERVASYLVLRERGWRGFYLGGFDPSVAKQSPLVVILGATLERAIREGARELDFLRGPEPYKYRWGARDRVLRRIRIER